MTSKNTLLVVAAVLAGFLAYFLYSQNSASKNVVQKITDSVIQTKDSVNKTLFPLSISALRAGKHEGSDLAIVETLEPGSNYKRYYASYQSEGLTIYGLLTVPDGTPPQGGWPVIVFNHGYIAPTVYRTTERYIAYVDGFARNGYVVFRPDYRGHDRSEGEPEGAYGSNAYTVDVLNAVSSVKKLKDVNGEKIGLWGHSMGGFITLRNMVVRDDIKAGVIWAGVVASYPDLLTRWRRTPPRPTIPGGRGGWRQGLIDEFGEPETNPAFWDSISANSYLKDISGPVQIHHGTADSSVPVEFSQTLDKQLKAVGKPSELHVYEGDDHNISQNFNLAMQRSIEFFDTYVK